MFEATEEDTFAARNGRRRAITVGQVGMRCVYCMGMQSLDNNAQRAVCYPSSLKYIRKAMDNWREHHFHCCPRIPDYTKTKYSTMSRVGSTNAEKYRLESAQKLGLIDSPNGGIRFK
jgi:hypothetical protein